MNAQLHEAQSEIDDSFDYAGFTPPDNEWTKSDPRGHEYGVFKVCCVCGRLRVRWVGTSRCYKMYFDNLNDFRNWAKENT